MLRVMVLLPLGLIFLGYQSLGQPVSFWSKHKATVKAREKYFADAYFMGEHRVLDRWQSPLIYSGTTLGYSKAYISRSKSFYKEIALQFNYTSLIHGRSAPWDPTVTRAFYPQFTLNYLPFQLVADSSNLSIWIGAQTEMGWQFRINNNLQNSSLTYEFWLPSLGPSMRAERSLSFRGRRYRLFGRERMIGPGKFKAYASIHLPLVAWVSRPPYPSIADFVSGEDVSSTAFDQREPASLGSYRRAVIDWGIWWQGRERRSVSLGYRWEFYQIDRPGHRVQSGLATIYLRFHSLFRP